GHGCAEASHPALVRTMLHTDRPLNVDTAENEAPSSAERNSPFSVATSTMSLGVLVSTLRSRTEIVVPSSTTEPQLTPPFLDLTTAPPIRSWSYGSPRPR